MEALIDIIINGKTVSCRNGDSLLEIIRREGVDLPSLCYHPFLGGDQRCGLCLVEVEFEENERQEVRYACAQIALAGLKVNTDSPKVQKLRQLTADLLLKRHVIDENSRAGRLLDALAAKPLLPAKRVAESGGSDCCLLCGLCVRACASLGARSISFMGRGVELKVGSAADEGEYAACLGCSACYYLCPAGCVERRQEGNLLFLEPFGASAEICVCPGCGRTFATTKTIDALRGTLGSQKWLNLCPQCKREGLAQKRAKSGSRRQSNSNEETSS